MASQITVVSIVCSIVCSGVDQRKHQSSGQWPLCGEFIGDQWIPHKKDHLMTSSWILVLIKYVYNKSDNQGHVRGSTFAVTLWHTQGGFVYRYHRVEDEPSTHLARSIINSSTLDKMSAISQTFSDACSWMKSLVFWWKFHWRLFLRVQLTITWHWFR